MGRVAHERLSIRVTVGDTEVLETVRFPPDAGPFLEYALTEDAGGLRLRTLQRTLNTNGSVSLSLEVAVLEPGAPTQTVEVAITTGQDQTLRMPTADGEMVVALTLEAPP